MGFLKKLRKKLHLPAITLGNVAKVGAAVATGGVGGGALALGAKVLKSRLKNVGVGGIKQVLRTKAEKAIVAKLDQLAPRTAASKATTMPGGGKFTPGGSWHGADAEKGWDWTAKPRKARRGRKAAARPKRTAATKASRATPRRKATGAKRKAPTGGKDFKALSVSWRAAGKPGKWIDWVKGH